MEVYRSKDGHVAKYVHDDGSETSIKTTPTLKFGGEYGSVTNKYNIFISTSVGCPVGCTFCYLTTKKCPYHKLEIVDIKNNVISALKSELKSRPELHNMYTKLSWMGMGDAYVDLDTMLWSTTDIVDTLVSEGLSQGLDGVDISTTMPKIVEEKDNEIVSLAKHLRFRPLNPLRNYDIEGNNPVRVFYSLHSTRDSNRRKFIPTTVNIQDALTHLAFLRSNDITTIIHHMFFDGLNDTIEDLIELKDLMLSDLVKGTELRILRFNECPGTTFKESEKFGYLIEVLLKHDIDLKVQSSPGSTVLAACGQFMLSRILNK